MHDRPETGVRLQVRTYSSIGCVMPSASWLPALPGARDPARLRPRPNAARRRQYQFPTVSTATGKPGVHCAKNSRIAPRYHRSPEAQRSHTIWCRPPRRHRRAQTRFKNDIRRIHGVLSAGSNRKPGFNAFDKRFRYGASVAAAWLRLHIRPPLHAAWHVLRAISPLACLAR